MKININTDAAVVFTNKLEKIHRSAFPSAVRGTLNKAAFDVKQNTMLKSSADAFEKRQPNFFKANSRVEIASGWDVTSMKATVGFTSENLKGESNFAVKDLEQQEQGGTIKSRSFIPITSARANASHSKPVRPMNRLSKVKNIVNASKASGKSDKQKFVKSVLHAGIGGYVLSNFKGNEVLWRVNSLRRTKKGQFKLTPLYSHVKNRSVQVEKTAFMERASLESAEKLEAFYISEAKRQIDKL